MANLLIFLLRINKQRNGWRRDKFKAEVRALSTESMLNLQRIYLYLGMMMAQEFWNLRK